MVSMSIQSMVRPISDSLGATMAPLFSRLQAAAHSPQPLHFCRSITIPHFIGETPYLLIFSTRTSVDCHELRPLKGSTRWSSIAIGFAPMFFAFLPDSVCPWPNGTDRISVDTVVTIRTGSVIVPFPEPTRIRSPPMEPQVRSLFAFFPSPLRPGKGGFLQQGRQAGGGRKEELLFPLPVHCRIFPGIPPAPLFLEQAPEIREGRVAVNLPAAFAQVLQKLQGNRLEVRRPLSRGEDLLHPCREDLP